MGDDLVGSDAAVPAQPVRITLDLGLDAAGRPAGSVWAGSATPQAVFGWLELMSELTRLLSEGGADADAGEGTSL